MTNYEKIKAMSVEEMAERKRYFISEEEIALLEHQEGATCKKSSEEYMEFSKESLAHFCYMKDVTKDLFQRRYEAAFEVIDIIAKKIGIDPDNTGFWLYAPEEDGTTPITDRLNDWFSRSGEKAKLKRRVQELEDENAMLRSLIVIKQG